MTKYIFIDNWILGSLRKPGFHSALRDYVRRNEYTVLLSSLSFVELYNPGWNNSEGPDRTQRAVKFYSEVPCVVVNPRDLWDAEIENQLDPLDDLPRRLDLKELDSQWREETLLRFLRADDLYLEQGHDVREWDKNYKRLKEQWLIDVERIIEEACKSGNLVRGEKGRLVQLSEHKELFLFSLDLRHAPPNKVDVILTHQVERRLNGEPVRLSAVRLLFITDSLDPSLHRSSSQKPVNSPANYRRIACR